MKVGDLVFCPVDLITGEMFCDNWELAIITAIYKNEPKILVHYVNEYDHRTITGVWFTEEVKLANES